MLVIVAHEIGQRESIVGSNEVDAGVRAPSIMLVKIGTAREPVSHLSDAALVAFPKTADSVAVFAIPLCP